MTDKRHCAPVTELFLSERQKELLQLFCVFFTPYPPVVVLERCFCQEYQKRREVCYAFWWKGEEEKKLVRGRVTNHGQMQTSFGQGE